MSVSTAPRAVTALFSTAEEFLEELELEAANVERKIVRVTKRGTGVHGGINSVFIEAGFIVEGRLVRLQAYIGSLWGVEAGDAEVNAKAEEMADQITEVAAGLGLKIRAGAWASA